MPNPASSNTARMASLPRIMFGPRAARQPRASAGSGPSSSPNTASATSSISFGHDLRPGQGRLLAPLQVLNVAIPQIATNLGAGAQDIQWIIDRRFEYRGNQWGQRSRRRGQGGLSPQRCPPRSLSLPGPVLAAAVLGAKGIPSQVISMMKWEVAEPIGTDQVR
jgi:hypothetical protein